MSCARPASPTSTSPPSTTAPWSRPPTWTSPAATMGRSGTGSSRRCWPASRSSEVGWPSSGNGTRRRPSPLSSAAARVWAARAPVGPGPRARPAPAAGRGGGAVLAAAPRGLAAEEGGGAHLAGLAAALPPADVLRGLRRLAQEQGQLSSHALRMAQALAEAHEDLPPTEGLPEPPADFAAMAALFREEDGDRYNPEDHRALLAQKPTLDPAPCGVELPPAPDTSGPAPH